MRTVAEERNQKLRLLPIRENLDLRDRDCHRSLEQNRGNLFHRQVQARRGNRVQRLLYLNPAPSGSPIFGAKAKGSL